MSCYLCDLARSLAPGNPPSVEVLVSLKMLIVVCGVFVPFAQLEAKAVKLCLVKCVSALEEV